MGLYNNHIIYYFQGGTERERDSQKKDGFKVQTVFDHSGSAAGHGRSNHVDHYRL